MKDRSLSRAAFHLDLPVVLVDDPMGNGEAEADSSFLCRKERVEEFIDVLSRDTHAGVLYGELYPSIAFWNMTPQRQVATLRHRLDSV